MKINKRELLTTLKQDVKSAENYQNSWMNKVRSYREQTEGLPYGNEAEGRSALVSKDIKKQLEWLLPSMADPFLSGADIIKCNPITFEDTLAARQSELLLNSQFCRKFNRYNFVMKSLRVLATEGTVVVRTGWDYEDKEEMVTESIAIMLDDGTEAIAEREVKVTKVLKNQPTAIVCRNDDVFIDPACMDDMDKCQFVCHRYETDLSTLIADGRYKNLEKIGDNGTTYDGDYQPVDKTDFTFKDKARKKHLVYEYWGNYDIDGDGQVEPIVCAWIDNIIIRLETNPYPDGRPPFLIVPFNAVPFQMTGEALAENIGDNQKVKTAITRGIIDNMARSNNSQVGFKTGGLDATNRKKFLDGKNFEYRGGKEDFWHGGYNSIPGSVFDMLSMMNNEIESQTGVKSFSGGINSGALGNVATGVKAAMDAQGLRRLNQVRSLSENLFKPLMRKWLAYSNAFLEEEEIVRITNEEYVPIKRDDLAGNIDIDMNISTAEDNMAKSQELSFLLQTMGNTLPFDMTKIMLAKFFALSKVPELEKAVMEYQQQPDPAQEQINQLEIQRLMLENQKLQSEITRNYARADEDEIDKLVKIRKASVEEAKAKKLLSEADMLDLKFLQTNDGVDEDNKRMEREEKFRHEYEMKALDNLSRAYGGVQ